MIYMSGMSTDVDLISDDVDLMSTNVDRCQPRSTCLNYQNNTTKSPNVNMSTVFYSFAREKIENIYIEIRGAGTLYRKHGKESPFSVDMLTWPILFSLRMSTMSTVLVMKGRTHEQV
jgi:hypothetical protein